MSTVTVSRGSATNSSHGHDTGSPTAPLIVKLHSSRGVRGVGPADSTGKSRVTYWPGGTRAESTSARRPRKPRENGRIGQAWPSNGRPTSGAGDQPIRDRRWSDAHGRPSSNG